MEPTVNSPVKTTPVELTSALFSKGRPHTSTSTKEEGPLSAVEQFGPTSQVPDSIASGLARLYREIYGDRYISPLYADPHRIAAEINEGRWHAFVGLDRDGNVAGQVGLMVRPDNTLELGRDVVDPSARLKGSYKQLVRTRARAIQDIITRAGRPFDYQWAESVTGHEGSQRTYRNTLGFVPCGVGALKYPDVFGRGQRESVVLMVSIIDPTIRNDRPVFVPGSFDEIITDVFVSLGCTRTKRTQPIAPEQLNALQFTVRDKRQVGQISFDFSSAEAGTRFPLKQIDDLVSSMRGSDDVHHFSARMSLQDPRTPALVQLLSADGFTFSHVEPRKGGDILEVQKLVGNEPIDVRLIDVAMERMVRRIEETRQSSRHQES